MKTNDYFRLRHALAVVTAGLALGGMVGTASGQSQPMYRMALGSGGGVPCQATLTLQSYSTNSCTLGWYGTLGWYSILASANGLTNWNAVASVEATTYASQTTLPIPFSTNNYAFFQLYQYNSYAGASSCGSCHGSHYTPFLATAHANAYNALASEGMNNNASCLPCHTVGYNKPTGFTNAAYNANLEGVGCENCHGPAAWHKNSDHSVILPVMSLAPEICGSCHQGHNPQYNEYTNSLHDQVNDDINYGFEGGTYFTNTVVIPVKGVPTTLYGYYLTTSVSNGVTIYTTNATSGIISSSHVPGSSVDPGDDRQTSCGVCHSGAARMAMLTDYNNRLVGYTNALVLPAAVDAGSWGPTCANCHDPHSLNPSPVFADISNAMVAVAPQYIQLRNPTWSSNFFTMASQSDKRYDSNGNPFYMNTTFASMYNPAINVCGQCHNTRGARWDGRGYGLLTNSIPVTNMVIAAAYTNVYYTNYNIYGQITGVITNPVPTGGNVTNYVVTNYLAITTGLTTNINGFSRAPHNSPQYNMLIGILQPDYLNSTNGKAVYTNGPVNNGIGIYATHSGIAARSIYNTNQCATCHVPSYTAATGNVTGHTFNLDPNGCALGGCHTSGWPDYPDYRVETTNTLAAVVDLLNAWATNNAPGLFTNYSKYLQNSWEYTSPGPLASLTNSGPSSADQLLLPTNILQARFDLYMVRNDGSLGVHNPTFIPLLLKDAETKVLNLLTNIAEFTSSSQSVATNATVTFTWLNPSATPATWHFGDGLSTNTAATTVTHKYSAAGAYSVTLVPGDGVTQSLTRNNYINVYVLPTANFTYVKGSVTNSTQKVTYTDTSLNNAYVTWSFYASANNYNTTNRIFVTAALSGASVTCTYTNITGTVAVVLKASSPGGSVSYTNNTISLP